MQKQLFPLMIMVATMGIQCGQFNDVNYMRG